MRMPELVYMVTTSLKSLELSGNLTAGREMPGNCPNVRKYLVLYLLLISHWGASPVFSNILVAK